MASGVMTPTCGSGYPTMDEHERQTLAVEQALLTLLMTAAQLLPDLTRTEIDLLLGLPDEQTEP